MRATAALAALVLVGSCGRSLTLSCNAERTEAPYGPLARSVRATRDNIRAAAELKNTEAWAEDIRARLADVRARMEVTERDLQAATSPAQREAALAKQAAIREEQRLLDREISAARPKQKQW